MPILGVQADGSNRTDRLPLEKENARLKRRVADLLLVTCPHEWYHPLS